MMKRRGGLIWLKALLLGLGMAGALFALVVNLKPASNETEEPSTGEVQSDLYDVVSVIDGDTIKINYDGKKVRIEADSTQTDRDKYDRLLRYVYLDSEDVGLGIISNGYGYEYTYNVPYAKQAVYKQAQADAESASKGLWADGVCSSNGSEADADANGFDVEQPRQENDESASVNGGGSSNPSETSTTECNIKGNISYSGEKIYHVPGQQYYDSTVINTEYGERWFCSEAEAQAAGWRRSKV